MDSLEEYDKCYTDSMKSTESQIDSANELMKIVEENYERFKNIVNQTIPVGINLEKDLAKEDKRCTFLQYKIEDLNKRYSDAIEISASLQKYVRTQQMEIEEIGAVICEQLEQLNMKFPADRLSQHFNAVSIISNAVRCIKDLKQVLLNDLEVCNRKNGKLSQQRDTFLLRINYIQKLETEKTELERNLKTVFYFQPELDLNLFEQHLSLLNEKFHTCQILQTKERTIRDELNELKQEETEISKKCQELNKISIESLHKYQQIMDILNKKCDRVANEQNDVECLRVTFTRESDIMLSHVMQQMKIFESEVNTTKRQFDEILARKFMVSNGNQSIIIKKDQLKSEHLKLGEFIKSCHDQRKISIQMKETIQQQITVFGMTTENSKFLLEQLQADVNKLKFEQNLFSMESSESCFTNLDEMINSEQKDVEQNLDDQQKLNEEKEELKHIVEQLANDNNKLNNELKSCRTEHSFYESFIKNSENELRKIRENRIVSVHKGIKTTMKDITNANCNTSEQRLLMDILQTDIRRYNAEAAELQRKVWTLNEESDKSRHEAVSIQEAVTEEKEAYENCKKLYEDLSKNSFPKSKIPANWFKSFEKQRMEYDSLVKKRLELEKQRNKLLIDLDSESFQENKLELSDTVDVAKTHFSDIKNAMYDIFKERVRKKRSTK